MSKHTPGPWSAGHYSSVVGVPISAQPDHRKNTVIVAVTRHRAREEANARLIAAAPEMAELLRDVVFIYGHLPTAPSPWWDSLRALLAKIEGDTP